MNNELIFDEDFIKSGDFYLIGYKNPSTGMKSVWGKPKYELDIAFKQRGWLKDSECLCFDMAWSEINDRMKELAFEELNMRLALDLNKLQGGYAQLVTENRELDKDLSDLRIDFAVMAMENIRMKCKLLTANEDNKLVISKI